MTSLALAKPVTIRAVVVFGVAVSKSNRVLFGTTATACSAWAAFALRRLARAEIARNHLIRIVFSSIGTGQGSNSISRHQLTRQPRPCETNGAFFDRLIGA